MFIGILAKQLLFSIRAIIILTPQKNRQITIPCHTIEGTATRNQTD